MRTNQLQIMSCVNCEKIKTLRLPRKKHFEALSKEPIRNRLKSWWVWHTMSCHKFKHCLSQFNQDVLFKRRLCNAALIQELTKYHIMPYYATLKGLFSFAWLALSHLQKECLQKGWFVQKERGWYDAIGTERWWTRSKAAQLWNNELTQTSRDFVSTKVHKCQTWFI